MPGNPFVAYANKEYEEAHPQTPEQKAHRDEWFRRRDWEEKNGPLDYDPDTDNRRPQTLVDGVWVDYHDHHGTELARKYPPNWVK